MEAALSSNANEKRLHFAYSKLLLDIDGDKTTILYHLLRSFTPGDSNYDAQLLYARQLYIDGQIENAKRLFAALKKAPTSPEVRLALHYPLTTEYRGEVVRVETTYGFIARDGVGDWIYAYRDNLGAAWSVIALRARVVFKVAFTFAGPSAFEVRLETN